MKHYRAAFILLTLGLALGALTPQRAMNTQANSPEHSAQSSNQTQGSESYGKLPPSFVGTSFKVSSGFQECLPPPSNVVSWWSGDGHANDIQGNNHGTLQNGATFAPGLVGQAFSFDGNNDRVDVPFSNSLNLTGNQLTMDGWIKPVANTNSIYFGRSAPSDHPYLMFFAAGGIRIVVKVNNNQEYNTGYIPALNVWIHIALVYDGVRIRFYANGIEVFSAPLTGNLESSNLPFAIGNRASPDFPVVSFQGLIDEVDVLDRALSATEILNIFNAGSAGKCKPGSSGGTCITPPSGVVSWWPGDGNANDIQGSNHGALQNGATFSPGLVDQAFSFDGNNDRVDVPFSNSLNLTGNQLTMDGWIKPAANTNAIYFGRSAPSDHPYLMFFAPGGIRIVIKVNNNQEHNTGYIPALNVWTHLALVYDGARMRFYANGVEVFSAPQTGNLESSPLPFAIGNRASLDFPLASFHGLIDEVGVYNRALSATEILNIFNAGQAGKCKAGGTNEIDLAISKSHTGDFVAGQTESYTITVTNVGTAANTGLITVTDTLPPTSELSYLSANGTGWSCSGSSLNQIVTCVYSGSLAPGATAQFTLNVNVSTQPIVTEFDNIARVETAGDTNASNNEARDHTRIIGIPDLEISKSHSGNFVVGNNGVYTITVRNIGSMPASGLVRMVDTLPAGLSYVSAAAPSGWTCGLASGSSSVVECATTNHISANQSFTFTLTVAVGSAAVPGVTNRVNVSAANEFQSGNNQAEDPTVVVNQSAGNTPPGSNVAVQPLDSTSGASPATLTFAQVTQAGNTTLTITYGGAPPPSGFSLGNPPTGYELNTTASFTAPIQVCINYNGVSFFDEAALRFFHFENGQWVDITTSLDTQNNVICGLTNSLSPFAIFQQVYQFSGFFAPVANAPTINVVNAGSAVPLKFSLGGNQGLDIFAAGSPQSQMINCDTNSPQSSLEATVTAGSSSLSYDPSTGQYTYVWKTDKAWAGSCRQLIVKLKDGTQRVAYFKFK